MKKQFITEENIQELEESFRVAGTEKGMDAMGLLWALKRTSDLHKLDLDDDKEFFREYDRIYEVIEKTKQKLL